MLRHEDFSVLAKRERESPKSVTLHEGHFRASKGLTNQIVRRIQKFHSFPNRHTILLRSANILSTGLRDIPPQDVLRLPQINHVAAVRSWGGTFRVSAEERVVACRNYHIATSLSEMLNHTVQEGFFLGHIKTRSEGNGLNPESHHSQSSFPHDRV